MLSYSLQAKAFEAVCNALANGSKTLAAAEFKYFAACSKTQAVQWVEHLLSCLEPWPLTVEEQATLQHLKQVFSENKKPLHFTNYKHCDECKAHDDTLRSKTRHTISRRDLGNLGWDPMCFSNAEGFAYYFPTMAHYALLPDVWRDRDWYVNQLLGHLANRRNEFFQSCAPCQREAIYKFLQQIAKTHGDKIECLEEFDKAIMLWRNVDDHTL